jgi:hypothetical protein
MRSVSLHRDFPGGEGWAIRVLIPVALESAFADIGIKNITGAWTL